jgi:hypothetical protein
MKYGYVSNDKEYDFFYDESNNIRVFTLNGERYNTDNNPQNPYSPIFIIGGLVVEKRHSSISKDEIYSLLEIQKKTPEIKLKHLAKGDFSKITDSPKIYKFLDWLYNSKYMMHYFAINTVYWSFLDIIEDSVHYLLIKNDASYILDGCRSEDDVRARIDYFKNSLYILIKQDKSGFLNYIKKFNYPKITQNDTPKFYRGLHKLTRKNSNLELPYNKKLPSHINNKLVDLTRFFAKCKEIDNSDLIFNDEEEILIDSFSSFYVNRMMGFLNSKHILDNEDTIEPEIESLVKGTIPDNPYSKIDYVFVDSETNIEIQLSDIVSGLIRLLYSFVETSNQDEIENFLKNASELQKKNLKLLYENILKSEKECEGFIYRIQVPVDEYKMSLLFSS